MNLYGGRGTSTCVWLLAFSNERTLRLCELVLGHVVAIDVVVVVGIVGWTVNFAHCVVVCCMILVATSQVAKIREQP